MSDDIDYIKDKIKEAYTIKRRVHIPYYNPGDKNEKDFLKAAEICKSIGADPVMWVEAAAMHNPLSANEFYPTLLHCAKAVDNYIKFMQFTASTPEEDLRNNIEYLRREIERKRRTVEDVLMDDEIPLDAWFRVSATKVPIPAVEAKYRNRARRDLTPSMLEFLKQQGKHERVI